MEQLFPRQARAASDCTDAQAFLEEKKRDIESRNKPYQKAQAAFIRERKAILTPDAVRQAVPIFEAHRDKFARAALKFNGDVGRVTRRKKAIQASMRKSLLQTVPNYDQYLTRRKAYTENHNVLFGGEVGSKVRNDIRIDLGEEVASTGADF